MRVKRGYTLIEILVAVAIFGLLIGPIYSLISSTIKTNQKAKERIEIANVLNYAYEGYLKDKDNPPTSYMGYQIEYITTDNSQYTMAGITYSNDFDYKMLVSSFTLLLDRTNKIRLKVEQISSNKLKYTTYLNGTKRDEDEKENPKAKVIVDFNGATTDNIQLLIDGVYDSSGYPANKMLSVSCLNANNNIKFASVYPNVEFNNKLIDPITETREQDTYYITIKIKKNGREESKVFSYSTKLK